MRYVVALAIALVAAPTASAQQPITRQQLNGEWTGTLVLDNSSPQLALVFQLTDSAFAGKVYADGEPMGDMEGGSLVANRVHFKVDRFDFIGTIEGATMRIDLVVWNGSTRTFRVRKTAAVRPDSTATRPPGSIEREPSAPNASRRGPREPSSSMREE